LHSTQETQAGQMTKIFDKIRVFIKIYENICFFRSEIAKRAATVGNLSLVCKDKLHLSWGFGEKKEYQALRMWQQRLIWYHLTHYKMKYLWRLTYTVIHV